MLHEFHEKINSSVADPGFSPRGAPTSKIAIVFQIFAENCMKMEEFRPPEGRASLALPLDPPMFVLMYVIFVVTSLFLAGKSHN